MQSNILYETGTVPLFETGRLKERASLEKMGNWSG